MPASNNEEKILATMFVLLNQGNEEPTKDRVKKMARVSAATFPSLISRIVKSDGTIEYGSGPGTLKLTRQGPRCGVETHAARRLGYDQCQGPRKHQKDLERQAFEDF